MGVNRLKRLNFVKTLRPSIFRDRGNSNRIPDRPRPRSTLVESRPMHLSTIIDSGVLTTNTAEALTPAETVDFSVTWITFCFTRLNQYALLSHYLINFINNYSTLQN